MLNRGRTIHMSSSKGEYIKNMLYPTMWQKGCNHVHFEQELTLRKPLVSANKNGSQKDKELTNKYQTKITEEHMQFYYW